MIFDSCYKIERRLLTIHKMKTMTKSILIAMLALIGLSSIAKAQDTIIIIRPAPGLNDGTDIGDNFGGKKMLILIWSNRTIISQQMNL